MKKIKSLFRFDKIRLCKLLEISQNCIIGFIITIIIGNILNVKIFNEYDLENVSTYYLFLNIISELILMVIIIYYIRKIVNTIPFMFGFITNKYIPSKKDESQTGYVIGSGLIMIITLNKLDRKIEELDKRIKTYLNK
tara:strand:- start:246 stop:659 length:414 start_codon:yes stop_codon:yes gene_type:complete